MKKSLKQLCFTFLSLIAYSQANASVTPKTMDEMATTAQSNKLPEFQKALLGLKVKTPGENREYRTCSAVALNQYTILTTASCLLKSGTVSSPVELSDVRVYVVDDTTSKTHKTGKKLTFSKDEGVIDLATGYTNKDRIATDAYRNLAIIKLKKLVGDKIVPLGNTLEGLQISFNGNLQNTGSINEPKDWLNTSKLDKEAVYYRLGFNYEEGDNIYQAGYGICGAFAQQKFAQSNFYANYLISYAGIDVTPQNKNFCNMYGGSLADLSGYDIGGPLFIQTKDMKIQLVGIVTDYSYALGTNTPTLIYGLLTNTNSEWAYLRKITNTSPTL